MNCIIKAFFDVVNVVHIVGRVSILYGDSSTEVDHDLKDGKLPYVVQLSDAPAKLNEDRSGYLET